MAMFNSNVTGSCS